MPADGSVTAVAKNEVFGIINFVPLIYYEKSATRNVFLRKKNFREEIYWKRVVYKRRWRLWNKRYVRWVHFYKSFVTLLDRSCMTFVSLALFKDTTHLYTAGCRETMWKKRLCLRKRRPSDKNQVALATPQLELPSFPVAGGWFKPTPLNLVQAHPPSPWFYQTRLHTQ